MNIGVDVDGVLLNTPEFMRKYGERYFKRPPADPDAYEMEDMFRVSHKQVFFFGLRWFLPYYCRKYPPYPQAGSTYGELIREGNKIFQITSRKATMDHNLIGYLSRRFLNHWLRDNGFFHDKLFYCHEEGVSWQKLMHCLENNVDVMIDDNPVTANVLANNGIRVLLYDAPYNQSIEGDHITRVKNWNEIREILCKEEEAK